jgi:hypothetical protein
MRPKTFEINKDHHLARGLVFAGLGNHGGGSQYYDSSVYGNHGTLTNINPATGWGVGRGLRYTILDKNNNDYIDIPNKIPNLVGSSHTTLACWFRRDGSAFSTTETIVGSDNAGVVLSLVTSLFRLRGVNRGTAVGGTDAQNTTANTWYHAAITYNGATQRLYWDGVEVAINVDADRQAVVSNYLRIGAGPTPSEYFGGDVADILFWTTRTLSAGEIQQLADPSNVMLSGLIKPNHLGTPAIINDMHWVGKSTNAFDPNNWSTEKQGRGGAGVPRSGKHLFFDADSDLA